MACFDTVLQWPKCSLKNTSHNVLLVACAKYLLSNWFFLFYISGEVVRRCSDSVHGFCNTLLPSHCIFKEFFSHIIVYVRFFKTKTSYLIVSPNLSGISLQIATDMSSVVFVKLVQQSSFALLSTTRKPWC